jgi:DNA-binding XRE family transcriptional regulator
VSPVDYCRERVAVPGSSYYYSMLWLGPEVQHGLYALLAFKDAIAEVPRTCTDPAVARMKLAFWREELARIEAHEPARHLIAELMGWVARTCGWEPQSLGPTLVATEEDVGPGGYACHEALVRHFQAMCGPGPSSRPPGAGRRPSAGLSKEKLARRLGVHPDTFSQWEQDIRCPTIGSMEQVTEILRLLKLIT